MPTATSASDLAPDLLRTKRASTGRSPCAVASVIAFVFLGTIGIASLQFKGNAVSAGEAVGPKSLQENGGVSALPKDAVEVYLGNGCFWERQWAYYNVETLAGGPFARAATSFTAYVGYAGGRDPPAGRGTATCYHTGDERDYSRLGSAEAVRVALDADRAAAQMKALARDFFDSFTGAKGARQRPDPMDRGPPYRSFAGFPGGMSSPLYAVFAAENTWGMALKPGAGGDADEFNTVWIYDTAAFPFYRGEVFHQNHCNFFQSEGMPYPDAYTVDLFKQLKEGGKYAPTGCPEDPFSHGTCGGGLLGRRK
jgi:peptide methionine sulfoxide reductase MsrA